MLHDQREARIAVARSFLFVPGDRPDRFDRAARANADIVVLDLEDSVPPSAKRAARLNVETWLKAGHEAVIRINDPSTTWFDDDLALSNIPGLLGFMLPKAAGDGALTRTTALAPTIALVETALGVSRMSETLTTKGVVRLAFGTIDLALDLATTDEAVIQSIGIQLVVASRAAGAAPPIDGVTVDIRSSAVVEHAMRAARARGFGGKLCIHPAQIEPVHAGLRPSADAIAQAQRIVEADRLSGGAAVALDGIMIDRPVVAHAYRVLSDAG